MARKGIIATIAALVVGGGVAAGTAYARKNDLHVVPNSQSGPMQILTIKDVEGTPVRVMKIGGAYQSATYVDEKKYVPAFKYYLGFDRMFDADLPIDRVLMLGGGGFAYPKHLMSTRDDVVMDVVEIDPAVVRAARKWFYLDELIQEFDLEESGRLNIFEQDAVEFVAAADPGTYDAVINDVFDGAAPSVSLLTSEGLAQAKQALKPGGLYLLNAVIESGDTEMLSTFMKVLGEGFANVYAIPCTDELIEGEDNYLLIASDANYAFQGVVGMLCN